MDPEWRRNSLSVLFKGFASPRGAYNVTVSTSTSRDDEERGREGKAAGGKGGKDEGGKGVPKLWRAAEVEDQWLVSYVLGPTSVSGRGHGDARL